LADKIIFQQKKKISQPTRLENIYRKTDACAWWNSQPWCAMFPEMFPIAAAAGQSFGMYTANKKFIHYLG
jgi:hypothetical protein